MRSQIAKENVVYKQVPLADVIPNPDQPRKDFDQEALEALADSIKENGLLQAITVRPVGEQWQIVAGERRWRACNLAGLVTIEVSVVEVNDRDNFMLSLMENTARRDMNPMEEANAYQKGLDLGFTPEEIEKSAGLIKGTVLWKVKMLRLIESAQHLVQKGHLSTTYGSYLSKLGPNGQLRVLAEFQKRKLSEQEFKTMVDLIWAEENQIPAFPELKVDEKAVKTRDAFHAALRQIAAGAATIQNLDKKSLAAGIEHEADRVDGEVQQVLRALGRTARLIQRARGRKAVRKNPAA